MAGQEIRADSSANAFEEALAQLLRAISIGRYMVGEKLPPERELASDLGVSRATLRIALRELREAGIVDVTRGRYGGTEVVRIPYEDTGSGAPISEEEIDDVLRFRELLEAESARLAAEADLTAADRRMLSDLCSACRNAPLDQHRAYDSKFHIGLSTLAGIPSLTAAIEENRVRVNALLDRIPMMSANLEHSNTQHSQLVDAILKGDPQLATRLARDHTQGTAILLRGFLNRSGE